MAKEKQRVEAVERQLIREIQKLTSRQFVTEAATRKWKDKWAVVSSSQCAGVGMILRRRLRL